MTKSRWTFKLLLLVIGTATGVVLAEGLLRIVGVSYPLPYFPDPHCGTRLQPNFAAWFTSEGRAYVQVNSAGFRDREHDVKKPPGTLRIAVLGDSYAEALQVPQEATFWSVLERQLNERGGLSGQRVEVLNFGISGFGTAQELQVLRHHVWPYQPDIVLLAFYAGNDIRNNSPELEPDQTRPFFHLRDGRLVLDDSFLEDPRYLKANSPWVKRKVAWINRSRLLQCLAHWKNHLADRQHDNAPVEHELEQIGIFRPPSSESWQRAWQITEALLAAMNRESQQHGAQFVVVCVTHPIQVHADPAVRETFCRAHGLESLDWADEHVEAIGQELGFPVIRLAPEFRRYAERHGEFLHGFANTEPGNGHWNALGHQLAAQQIADALRRIMNPVPSQLAQ